MSKLPLELQILLFWWGLTGHAMTKTTNRNAWLALSIACIGGYFIPPASSLSIGIWVYAVGAITAYLLYRFNHILSVVLTTISLGLLIGMIIRALIHIAVG